jgi:aminomethyltransferase
MKTPFYEKHESLHAKMVDFHGWFMPLQYSGIINEHVRVRTRVGLFDVSHMGRFRIEGPNSLEFLQKLMTNDIAKLQENQASYSLMCHDTGGILDDLIVYRIGGETFLLVVNASNREKDFEWILEHARKDKTASSVSTKIEDITDRTALLALQGPLAQNILQKIAPDNSFDQLKPFSLTNADLFSVKCIISRTGYTGEDGFELFFNSSEIQLWDKLLQEGSDSEIAPAGLGARDSLRLEAGLLLYGNDMDEQTTPLEVPLGWTVKFDKKEDFIGKRALQSNVARKKLVGFEMLGKRIARAGNEVFLAGKKIGSVTSGGFSPTYNKSIGFCFVPPKVQFEQMVDINITSASYPAKITGTRFYKRDKQVPR